MYEQLFYGRAACLEFSNCPFVKQNKIKILLSKVVCSDNSVIT